MVAISAMEVNSAAAAAAAGDAIGSMALSFGLNNKLSSRELEGCGKDDGSKAAADKSVAVRAASKTKGLSRIITNS